MPVSCRSAGVPSPSEFPEYPPAFSDEVITLSALAGYNGEPFGGAGRVHQVRPEGRKEGQEDGAGYKTISGTSMASPHVSRAAAVYVANSAPSATPAQVRSFVVAAANTEAKGAGHFDTFGLSPEPVLQMDNY